jgi:calcineurin-like phosphoesterase family protein
MTIWLTADLHIGHFNIIRYCNRPFKDLDQMHETIIGKWNQRVQNGDIVYLLGDLGFVNRSDLEISSFLSRVNGEIYLIRGNHDKGEKNWYLKQGIREVHDHYLILENSLLSHYPMEHDIYDGKRTGKLKEMLSTVYLKNHCNYHYYAHTHRPPAEGDGFMNVGVDLHDYYPVKYLKAK